MQEAFAGRYRDLERWHWWFRGRRRILAPLLRRFIGLRDGPRVAVLGSGPPQGLGWIREALGAGTRITALDADPSGVLRTALISGSEGTDEAAFACGTVERLPFRDACFDAALALDVLEHLGDDRAGLAEAARIVRPGGLLLVTVPALPSLWGRQDVTSHHLRRYTRRSLEAVFRQAGIGIDWISGFNTLLLPAIAAVRWSSRWLPEQRQQGSDFDLARPGVTNELLERVFASERHLLGRVRLPLGVSLVAAARIAPSGGRVAPDPAGPSAPVSPGARASE